MAGAQPVQPLPDWMSRTALSEGGSTVTIALPQTYSGAPIPGLTWPWVSAGGDPNAGTLVSIVGGTEEGLVRVGGTTAPPEASSMAGAEGTASGASVPVTTGGDPAVATLATQASSAGSSPNLSSPASSSTSGPSPSITPTFTTSTPTSSETLAADPNVEYHSPGLSSGVVIAIVVGIIAFVFLISLIIALCIKSRRRKERRANRLSGSSYDPEDHLYRDPYDSTAAGVGPYVSSRSGGDSFVGASAAAREASPSPSPPETQGLISHREDSASETRMEALASEHGSMSGEQGGGSLRAIESARQRDVSGQTDSSSNPTTSTGGSTTTRGSLIAQFPTYTTRRPSDQDSPGGGVIGKRGSDRGGEGGAAAAGDAALGPDSPGTMASTELFSAPPPRAPSRTRTVPLDAPLPSGMASTNSPLVAVHSPGSSSDLPAILAVNALGLGRPSQSPSNAPTERNTSPSRLSYRPVLSRSDSTASGAHDTFDFPSESVSQVVSRSVSNSSTKMVGWLRGFGFLKPYLGGNAPIPTTPVKAHRTLPRALSPQDRVAGGSHPPQSAEEKAQLLPSTVPVERAGPSYRRVTTTAAAYDLADLEDLKRKPTITYTRPSGSGLQAPVNGPVQRQMSPPGPSYSPFAGARMPPKREHESGEEGDDSDDDDRRGDAEDNDNDESRSFLSHGKGSSEGSAAARARYRAQSPRRMSRNTLGRPIKRVSGMSQVSLVDARSISESIAGSVIAARSRANSSKSQSRSRSNSASAVSHLGASSSASVSRAGSTGAQSHSSHSVNGSHGSASRSGSGKSRRHGNSSDGSAPRRSEARLRKVSENPEQQPAPRAPPLPPPPMPTSLPSTILQV